MNIDAYILELLNSHECVIIPDFGGFIKNYISAEILDKDKSFRSPHNEILFNTKLQKNDGLLINYISEKNDISYKSAELELNKYKTGLKNSISNSGKVSINGLGELYYRDNNIVFSCKTREYFSDTYGLSDFYFPELESYEQDATTALKVEHYQTTLSRKISLVNFKRVALLIPVFIVFLLLPNKVRMEKESENTATFNMTKAKASMADSMENIIHSMTSKKNALLYSEPEKDDDLIALNNKTEKLELGDISEKKETEKPVVIEKNNEKATDRVEVSNNKTEKPFQLIAGSFATKYRAELFIKNLKIKNIKAFVLNKQNGRFRVSLGSYDKRPSAEQALANVRDTADLKVWLLAR